MGLFKCEKCPRHGLYFDRSYGPDQFLEGKPDSLLWIIGLNPKGGEGSNDDRTIEQLQSYFDNKAQIAPYFKDFRGVSRGLYDLLGKNRGVAHTDWVKCFSSEFPPKTCGRDGAEEIIESCKWYLITQINRHKPRMLICNGMPVCKVMVEMFPPSSKSDTAYIARIERNEIVVILSGFVGRMDNYAKRRLGREIEYFMEQLNLGVHFV